jgi:hypothetical protein
VSGRAGSCEGITGTTRRTPRRSQAARGVINERWPPAAAAAVWAWGSCCRRLWQSTKRRQQSSRWAWLWSAAGRQWCVCQTRPQVCLQATAPTAACMCLVPVPRRHHVPPRRSWTRSWCMHSRRLPCSLHTCCWWAPSPSTPSSRACCAPWASSHSQVCVGCVCGRGGEGGCGMRGWVCPPAAGCARAAVVSCTPVRRAAHPPLT